MQNNKRNYQRELDSLISGLAGTPSLLLHSCCAPCSSYCLKYLAEFFDITVLYYNPNISPPEEYRKRADEQSGLIARLPAAHEIKLVEGIYDPERFYAAVKGLENEPEGGERCKVCYRLRMEEAAKLARERGAEYFCTTLSISPLKNAEAINVIGEQLSEQYSVKWLPSDFKKKGGYLRSIELSKEYDLYRQNFCGCVYSKSADNL